MDGWLGRLHDVHVDVTKKEDSGWVLRVAAGHLYRLGHFIRATEDFFELESVACWVRVPGMRAMLVRRRADCGR